MQMVELWKRVRHLIAFRHVLGDFLSARMIVDMSVGIDDLHNLFLRWRSLTRQIEILE
jgi:hypothetical protein